MDINGTRFHLMTGAHDWDPFLEQQGVERLWWDRDRSALSLLPKVLRFPRRTSERSLSAEDRRGAACDRHDNIFWIANDEQAIRVLPAGTETAGTYWRVEQLGSVCDPESKTDFKPQIKPSDYTELRLRGLAVTREHYLIVGTVMPGGVLVFDLHGGGPPLWRRWPETADFNPFDMAAVTDGGVWILDRSRGSEARLWRLNRHFAVMSLSGEFHELSANSQDFQPTSGIVHRVEPRRFPAGLVIESGSPLSLAAPISVESLPDGSVLVLGSSADGHHSVIQRYRDGILENRSELSGGILEQVLADPVIRVHDMVFVADPANEHADEAKGELTLVLEDGNQALAFGLEAFREQLSLTVRPRYLPLRRYSGKGLVASRVAVYYDLDQRWYPLTEQNRRRYHSDADVDGLVFDGREPACRWHRVVVDACIPEGTQLQVFSRAADERAYLADEDWHLEPKLCLRGDGAEIVHHSPFAEHESTLPGTGTWELLFQKAQGRFIELRLRLMGDGRSSPRLRSLRIYYPRFSYLDRFLPAVYREDTHSAGLLDRFLANTEGTLSVLEDRIARAEGVLDSRIVSREYLDWLAGWLGATLDEEWTEARRRLFIDHAELLFRWRGTQIGMRAAIRLCIDTCPDASIFDELRNQQLTAVGAVGGVRVRIVERYLYRRLPGILLGDPTEQSMGLSITDVSTDLSDLGRPKFLSERYRAYLRSRYKGGDDPIAVLNRAWASAYSGFEQIDFRMSPPRSPGERRDWFTFVQRELSMVQQWRPEYGAYALHIRYQEALRRRYTEKYGQASALQNLNLRWDAQYECFEDIRFSPVLPPLPLVAEDWLAFLREGIGFTYAPVSYSDLPMYREFLARRYGRVSRLNREYGRSAEHAWNHFDDVPLPAEDSFPQGGRELHDWIQFVSLTLPIRRNAHRFTVLVPTEPGELPESRARRVSQVEAVVRREKPAHTDFEVKLFWALFQVGSARLGEDSIIGDGARYVAVILGGSYIGMGLLGHSQPFDTANRYVLGRDSAPRTAQGELNNE